MKNQGAITRFTMFLCLFIVTEAVCFIFSSFLRVIIILRLKLSWSKALLRHIIFTWMFRLFFRSAQLALSLIDGGIYQKNHSIIAGNVFLSTSLSLSLLLPRSVCSFARSFIHSFDRLQKMHREEMRFLCQRVFPFRRWIDKHFQYRHAASHTHTNTLSRIQNEREKGNLRSSTMDALKKYLTLC